MCKGGGGRETKKLYLFERISNDFTSSKPLVCSLQNVDGSWGTETERLLLMDSRDFNRIGIGIDDLIEAYMQVRRASNSTHATPN